MLFIFLFIFYFLIFYCVKIYIICDSNNIQIVILVEKLRNIQTSSKFLQRLRYLKKLFSFHRVV